MNKALLFATACVLAMQPWIPLAPVGAAEVSAKGSGRAVDAAGDVPYCEGDIVSATADWSDARLRFQVETACGADIETDPSVVGASALGFLIDTDADHEADFVAVYDRTNDGVLYDASDAVVCTGRGSHPAWTTYEIELAAGCLPEPFTFSAVLILDENPYGDSCTCPVDRSPVAGPVHRGSGPVLHGQGYWMLGQDGTVHAFGDAAIHGTQKLPGRAVDLEPTPSGRGYWVVNETGRVGVHGDAPVLGSPVPGALRPGERVTAISRTASGNGYWIFTDVGRALGFGDAAFFGDMRDVALNGPVLDAIPTPSGRGYYMVASDGGIFTFGDAVFQGSMGSVPLNAPVQSLVPDPDGVGYWLVASDGGIFAFEAEFHGSMGSTKLNEPVTGMVGFGRGYLMVAEDGGIFTFGDAPFFGSLGDHPPAVPIVSTAILNQ